MPDVTLLAGDCRPWLAALEPNSLDACVCDPPYELGFMGRAWDRAGVA
jgi:DNA modification methylase